MVYSLADMVRDLFLIIGTYVGLMMIVEGVMKLKGDTITIDPRKAMTCKHLRVKSTSIYEDNKTVYENVCKDCGKYWKNTPAYYSRKKKTVGEVSSKAVSTKRSKRD